MRHDVAAIVSVARRNGPAQLPRESGMSHQGTDGLTCPTPHHQALRRALDWLLAAASLSDLTIRGECSWTPKGLIFVAILWAWSDEKSLTRRFSHARKVVIAMD